MITRVQISDGQSQGCLIGLLLISIIAETLRSALKVEKRQIGLLLYLLLPFVFNLFFAKN